MNLTEFSDERLREKRDEFQAEIVERQKQLGDLECERREELKRLRRDGISELVLGWPPCTGLDGLCRTIIHDNKKIIAEIDAELERRRQADA